MRILHAVHGYPPELIGGTELYVRRLASALAARGHEVSVFSGSVTWERRFRVETFDDGPVGVTRVHRDDLYFDRWDKGSAPPVREAFLEVLRRMRPDVLHLHHWIRLSTDLVRSAAQLSVPTVVTLHDLYATCPRVFRLLDEGRRLCDRELAGEACVPCVPRWRFQSDEEVAAALRDYRGDVLAELAAARVRLAPTAGHAAFVSATVGSELEIDAEPLGSILEERIDPPPPSREGPLRLLCFGWMRPLKGVHVLLEALRRTRDPGRFRLALLGRCDDEAYRSRLVDLARGLDVSFEESYDRERLARGPLDLVCMPSLARESWSFALDEAAALGAPIAASDEGALGERATGRVRLFPRGDAEALAALLDGYADDRAALERMREEPPPVTVPMEEHAARLEGRYEEAVRAGAPETAPDFDRTRSLQQWRRREFHFRELVRTEHWEDVVAELRRRVAELEEVLRRRGRGDR